MSKEEIKQIQAIWGALRPVFLRDVIAMHAMHAILGRADHLRDPTGDLAKYCYEIADDFITKGGDK